MYLPPAAGRRQLEIEEAVERVQQALAPDVVRIRYEIGQNWHDEWCVFFRIVLTDDAAQYRLGEVGDKVIRALDEELDFPGLGVWPYHNFRSVSEQAVLQEPAWA